MMTPEELGWDEAFGDFYPPDGQAGVFTARVGFASRERWRLLGTDGEWQATLSGRARNDPEALHPAVGDWVRALRADAETAVILEVLPRRSWLARGASGGRKSLSGASGQEQILAANVTTALIVCGLDRDYNPRRIERYVALCYGGGVQPMIVLNKSDLYPDYETKTREAQALAPGALVMAISARRHEDVLALREHLRPGETLCLLGSSGAGKSTLLNALASSNAQATGDLSEATSKGRHTTTHRELFLLPGGCVIIDTPGLREVGLATEEGLDEAFSEIEEFSRRCRFRDCTHKEEPGCAVREAVRDGLIPPERWESYERLMREAHFRQVSSDVGLQALERSKWKSISKAIRQHYRSKG